MANPTLKTAKLSGCAWVDVLTHAGTAAQFTAVPFIMVSNTAIGDARISIRLVQGAVNTNLVGPDLLPEAGSYRWKFPLLVLNAGDKLQANVLGGVDMTIGNQIQAGM